MLAIAFYIIKVTICSGILFCYYWFVLRNKIFHQYNRFYLLASVVLSLLLPIVQINIWHNADTPAPQAVKLLQVVTSSNDYLDNFITGARRNNFTAEQLISTTYLLTTFIFLVVFVAGLLKIRLLFKRHQHTVFENIFFVNTHAKGTPFSFLRYIFWNDHIDPESHTGNQIFRHELAHVQQKHSYDKLFINIALVVFWMNPFFWLMRKELNLIHEFIADKIAVEDNDTESFAAMILQAAYPQHRFLTNPFFYSPIKRRLMMLAKDRNSKVGYIGRLLVLPLAFLIFAAFTLKTKTFKTSFSSYDGKPITIVLDAGHGGTDFGATSSSGAALEKDITLSIIKKIKSLSTNSKFNIVLTRESDKTQSVQEKADFTKAKNADLFISIHVDAGTEAKTSGMSIWVAKDNFKNASKSKLLASALINEFSNDYGLPVTSLPQQRQAGIKVLQEAACPAVLIEVGNITNQRDLEYVQSNSGIEVIASKVLAAIEKYAFAKNNSEMVSPAASPNRNLVSADNETIIDTVPKPSVDSKKALIILDGKVISNNKLKTIKPETIQSVNVLKGKTETAKYGDKGKNGVIVVTTKVNTVISNDVKVSIQQEEKPDVKTDVKEVIKVDVKNNIVKPLVIIDGEVQKEDFNINTIVPETIESIDVLKGKTAADKYGVKASNGALEIKIKAKTATKETTVANPVNAVNAVKVSGN